MPFSAGGAFKLEKSMKPTGTADQVLNGLGEPITPTDTPASGSKAPFSAGGAFSLQKELLTDISGVSFNQQYYLTAGTFTFTAPKDGRYMVEVAGAGGYMSTTIGGGGAYVRAFVTLTKGQQVTVTVGAKTTSSTVSGGASSFGNFATAPGGLGHTGGVPSSSAGSFRLCGGNSHSGSYSGAYGNGGSFLSSPGTPNISGDLNNGPGSGTCAGGVIITWL